MERKYTEYGEGKSASQKLFEFQDKCLLDANNFKITGLKWDDFPVAFFELVVLIAQDCNDNIIDIHMIRNRLFISGYSESLEEESEIMLRIGYKKRGLMLASVQFAHRRQGYMTKLYQILQRIANRYGYERIIIESVFSPEMKSWCKKNKLHKIDQHSYTNLLKEDDFVSDLECEL